MDIDIEKTRKIYEEMSDKELHKQFFYGKDAFQEGVHDVITAEVNKRNIADKHFMPLFFTTSTLKFILMAISTFGFYQLFWFYKNWRYIKERTNKDIMPFWRAVFTPFWTFRLFSEIHDTAKKNNISGVSYSIAMLTFLYLILSIVCARLPYPYVFFSFFSFIAVLPINEVALSVNSALVDSFENNTRFSFFNCIAILLGGGFFVLSIGILLMGLIFKYHLTHMDDK